eukprot:UN00438
MSKIGRFFCDKKFLLQNIIRNFQVFSQRMNKYNFLRWFVVFIFS